MTLTKIRKRDGRLAEFNEEKIARAIEKAFNATYKPGRGEEARKLADEVLSILEVEGQAQPDVEHIQDLVERVLMDNGYVQTAKSYILYREERSRAREMNTRLMKTYEDITFSKAKGFSKSCTNTVSISTVVYPNFSFNRDSHFFLTAPTNGSLDFWNTKRKSTLPSSAFIFCTISSATILFEVPGYFTSDKTSRISFTISCIISVFYKSSRQNYCL